MLDIKAIRKDPQAFKKALARKGVSASRIDELVKKDESKRSLQQRVEECKRQQNEVSKKIPSLKGLEKEKILADMKILSAQKKDAEEKLTHVEMEVQQILESLPNPPHVSAPDGKDETENKVIGKWGKLPQFDFTPLEHWELGERLGILDTERSAKVSGARFYYLRNELAILQRALVMWAFTEVAKKGYLPMIPPFLTNARAVYGTGYLAKDENYIVNPGEDDLYLIGTSEVPMVSFHADEILEEKDLPEKFVSYSPCFRREAGSYAKDMKGIMRVHQFEKVEMVVFCVPEDSEKIHEEIRSIEEMLLQKLEIPYQVVNVCCGDLGNSAARKYDLEAWLPGQGKYREMTSTSICTDFQSRRLNIRIRRKNGDIVFAHILNGTAVASRPLIAILENFQQRDGSVKIPKVLQDLCGFNVIKGKKL